MTRIPLLEPEQMSSQQRDIYNEVVAGPRGRMVGPLRAVIHSPELAAHWSKIGEYLRYSTCLPAKLSELAVIATGRRWNSQVEFYIHASAARQAGIDDAIIEAIRCGEAPSFEDSAEAEIYEFTRQLQETGNVEQVFYDAIVARWGVRGVVELTAVIGYYTMVSMTLNVHDIPLIQDAEPPFHCQAGMALTTLKTARRG